MSWEKTSWPICVVPSRWLHDGSRLGAYAVAWGSSGAISPGNTATNAIKSRITAPATAFRLRRTARRNRRGTTRSPAAGVSVRAGSAAGSPTAISRLPCARIEHGRDQVRDEHADEHGERVEEEQALHERQVVIRRGGVEQVAEPGVGEQVLDHDRPAEHVSELHRESRQVREDRVARGVVVHDAPVREPL